MYSHVERSLALEDQAFWSKSKIVIAKILAQFCACWHDMIRRYIYLLQLGFHQEAAVGGLVKNREETGQEEKQHTIQHKHTEYTK